MRPDISLVGVMSGIEMALWDICGKAVDKPVYELLGGRVHERLRSYTYLYAPADVDAYAYTDEGNKVYYDPDAAAERALHYVNLGFTAVKFDPAGPYTAFDPHMPSLERMELSESSASASARRWATRRTCCSAPTASSPRQAPSAWRASWSLMTRCGSRSRARRKCRKRWPRWPARRRYPVATGERLCTKYEFARVLETGAASILQFALGRVGGLLEAKKIAGMAEAHYAQIAPHLYCGPIEGAANVQIAACSPNFLILESIEEWGGFHSDILKKPMQMENGFVIPPSAPGLGVELNEEVALAHPLTDMDDLHIAPGEDPAAWND
jgi:galactonate dehydratase